MEDKKYIVYQHTCMINNKKYIGITCQTTTARWGLNGKNYLRKNKQNKYIQPLFANAILKYGWNNFTHDILKQNLTKDQAVKWEQKYIKKFHTNNSQYGCNSTSGGEIFEFNDMVKAKLSLSHLGEKSCFNIPVICIETQQTFFNMSSAAEWAQCDISNLSNVCNGKRDTAGGYHWRYVDDQKAKQADNVRVQRCASNKRCISGADNPHVKSVMCVETQQIFPSIKIAAKEKGIKSPVNISECCKGKRKTCHGYHWEYV